MTSSGLPVGWTLACMSEIADVQLGKMLDRGRPTQGAQIRYLRNANVRWGTVETDDLLEMPFLDAEVERYGVRVGDVLVCEGGEPGRAAVWRDAGIQIQYQKALHRVRFWGAFDPDLLVHRLKLDAGTGVLARYFTGTTIKHFTRTAFRSYQIPVPPLNEQRRIVAKIDALQARSRRAREALDAIPALLERFRQSVLAAAFRGDLTADWRAANPDVEPASELLERIRVERRERWIASKAETATQRAEARDAKKGKVWTDDVRAKRLAKETEKAAKNYVEPTVHEDADAPTVLVYGDTTKLRWAKAALEALCDPVRGIPYGIVKTGDATADGVPTVRCGDVKEFGIELRDLKRVALEVHEAYRRTWLEGGEVLLAIRGTVGNTAVANEHMRGMNISREVALIPVMTGMNARFLMYLIASPVGRELVMGHVKGVAQSGINLRDLRRLPTPIPPVAEQAAIVDILDEQVGRIRRLGRLVEQSAARLDTLDQATLAKAFRGELVPQDPNDEPASELLKRIQAERAAQAPKKRGRRRRKKTP